MKSITIVFASILVLCATQLGAQTTPQTPKTPKTKTTSSSSSSTTVSVHSDEDDGSSSYSYTDTSIDGKNKNTNISISISSSDDSYSLRAKFPEDKYIEVYNVLINEMNARNLTESNGKQIWVSNSNNEEVYKVILSKNKLTISLDKDVASGSLAEKFEVMGKTIRTAISGADNEARRDAERLQREADRLRRDAESMQREADRIQREADHQQREDAKRYRDDARALADKARKLANEASDLGTEANHRGGISSQVRTLLGENKTLYYDTTTNANNWTWPDAQKEMMSLLKKKGLIHTENDISFTYDDSGMYANGNKLSASQMKTFNDIFDKYNILKGYGFSFYKTHNHMVIIDDNADIDGFIKDLVSKKLISSDKEIALFEINGNSVYKDRKQLSIADLQTINSLLHKNNIIPAPGKILRIMKAGASKVGYALGEKSHLGTWKIKN